MERSGLHRITALQTQPRRKRVQVYLDGEYAFSLAASVARDLQVGQSLTPSQIQALRAADERARALQIAGRLLARRPRSRAELAQRLQRRGFAAALVAALLDELQAQGWLDDAAFARQWVENRLAFRPRGRARLRAELRAKGVAEEHITAALAEVDDEALAFAVARRALPRYQGLPWPVFARRLGGYLSRRGFPAAVVREVLQRLWHEQREPSEPDSEQGAKSW